MELRFYPDRVLRRRAQPVREITDEVAARVEQMLEVMYAAEGIGLAAPQVGWSRRIVTLDVDGAHQGQRVYVNPVIVDRQGHLEREEGCLSLPGVRAAVSRAAKVRVVAYTLGGEKVELEAEGLAACAWQHEMDHLNGLLIIDRLSPTALIGLREQLKKLEQEAQAGR